MSFTLSFVIPVFNEEGNVAGVVKRIEKVAKDLEAEHEIILVDDGSSDGTWNSIQAAKDLFPAVRGIRLSRNFGHQRALLAGLRQARGDVVVSMDGDLQHPPEIIPKLIEKWREGYKIVFTKRCDRGTTSAFKRLTSRCFYHIFSLVAEAKIQPGTSDFRLLDRKPLDELLQFREAEPFLRGSVELLGFPRAVVEFDVSDRHSGVSKYTLARMLRLARQGMVSHSSVPLRIGIWLGLATAFLAFLELGYIIVQVMRGSTVPGWASTVGITSLLFGVLFVVIGILGLYVADIQAILKRRPDFIIAEEV